MQQALHYKKMELAEIIRQETDRVFMVDYGCFIIFTGNTLDDSQPFIRIGNWIDMPPALIPLVENIIITENLIGNPAHEQFNIDINSHSSNRYIGSHTTLKRFLDFQSIFGLDLKNVTVVDVEYDIPEINSRNISDRETFIGIFYRGGNFKITHMGQDFFDLHASLDNSYNMNKIHDYLYENTKNGGLHKGSGFFFMESSLCGFSGGHYFLDTFPQNYRSLFDRFKINIKKIAAIAHNMANYLQLTQFLTWINSFSGKVTILSDEKGHFPLIKKLFSGSSITIDNYSNCNVKIGPDLSVSRSSGKYPVELGYKNGESRATIAHVKNREELMRALKSDVDALLMNYTLFEESTLLLKAEAKPGLIVDDGNCNFKKVSATSHLPLFPNTVYTVLPFDGADKALEYYSSIIGEADPADLFSADKKGVLEKIEAFFVSEHTLFEKLNYLSMIRYFIHITTNRRISSALSKLVSNIGLQYSVDNLAAMNIPFKATLIFADSGVFQTFEQSRVDIKSGYFVPSIDRLEPEDGEEYKDLSEFHETNRKIQEDRERLHKLISLYLRKPSLRKEAKKLQAAISERKELFKKETVTAEDFSNSSDVSDGVDTSGHDRQENGRLDNERSVKNQDATPTPVKGKAGAMLEGLKGKVVNGKKEKKGPHGAASHSRNGSVTRSVAARGASLFFDREKYELLKNGYSPEAIAEGSLNRDERNSLFGVNSDKDAVAVNLSGKKSVPDGDGAGSQHEISPFKALVLSFRPLFWGGSTALVLLVLALLLFLPVSPFRVIRTDHTEVTFDQLDPATEHEVSSGDTDSSQKGSGVPANNNEAGADGADQQQTVTGENGLPPAEKKDLEERIAGEANETIIAKNHILITDTEILNYVNRIADLNGYSRIPIAVVKGKNPHWIYPGNIFQLPDKELFIVKEGDSLWKIAELKLTKSSIEFYTAVDRIKELIGQNEVVPEELLEKARVNSINDGQKALVDDLEKKAFQQE